jgi:hypothetical protein
MYSWLEAKGIAQMLTWQNTGKTKQQQILQMGPMMLLPMAYL